MKTKKPMAKEERSTQAKAAGAMGGAAGRGEAKRRDGKSARVGRGSRGYARTSGDGGLNQEAEARATLINATEIRRACDAFFKRRGMQVEGIFGQLVFGNR